MRILKYLFTVLLVISVVVWTILLQKTHFNRAENFEWGEVQSARGVLSSAC